MKNFIYPLSSKSDVFILSSNPNANSLKIDLKLTLLLWVFLISGFGCKENVIPCEYEGCDPKRQTIKIAEEVRGRISVLDSKHPNLWVIVSEEGIIGQEGPIFDGPDIVVACNLPDSLKENGLKVIFSGELKDACDDFKLFNSTLYYSNLTQMMVKFSIEEY